LLTQVHLEKMAVEAETVKETVKERERERARERETETETDRETELVHNPKNAIYSAH